jgi:hypothetical protein
VAKSIEEYTAEISKAYDNSRNALQNQINAIEGNLAQTQKQINQNYDLQQSNIDKQKNWASSSASMAASRNGGSFGGATELANKKYYEQAYVPAQTQLNTGRSQALENAQSQANSNRLSLEQQLASMNDEISRLGVQRYYDELERERQEAARQQQIAAQNAWANYLNQGNNQTYKNWDFGNGYSVQEGRNGEAIYLRNGQQLNPAQFLQAVADGSNWDKWNDIWNNGVSTTGVGSDTIQGYINLRNFARNIGAR